MDDGILRAVLEWAWVSFIAMFAWVFRKVAVNDTSVQLLMQAQERSEKQRDEDLQRCARDREETISTINRHHTIIMKRLDKFADR